MKLYQGCCVCLSIINQWCDFRFKVHFIRCLLFSSLYFKLHFCTRYLFFFTYMKEFSLLSRMGFYFLLLNFATDLFYFFYLITHCQSCWLCGVRAVFFRESRWGELFSQKVKALTFNHCDMPVTINARIFGNGRNVFVIFFFLWLSVKLK